MTTDGTDEWVEWMWNEHARSVWSYAARRVGRDAADDVVSRTFLVLWRRADDYRSSRGRALPLSIAHKIVADHHRSSARASALVTRIAAQPPGSTGDGAHDEQHLAEVLGQALDPADVEILLLLAWDDLKPREVAKVIGVSPGATRKRIHDARRRARNVLWSVNSEDDLRRVGTVPRRTWR